MEVDILLGIAKLAAALLGFAGIVTAYRNQHSPEWKEDNRFWLMMIVGFFTLMFALLPVPFLIRGHEAELWPSACALLGAFYVSYVAIGAREFVLDRRNGRPIHLFIFIPVTAGHVVGAAILPASVIGIGPAPEAWLFFSGLSWLLLTSAIFFVGLLMASGLEELEKELKN